MIDISSSNIIDLAPDIQWRDSLWELLKDQRQEGTFCDLVIKCGSVEMKAHKIVLATISPYFRAQIFGSFSPTSIEQTQTLEMGDFLSESVELLLDLVYGQETNCKNIDVLDFIQLLDYIQVNCYYKTIQEAIRPHISLDNCLQLYHLSKTCNVKCVSDLISVFIGSNFTQLIQTETWRQVSKEIAMSLLETEAMSYFPLSIKKTAVCNLDCYDDLCQSFSKSKRVTRANQLTPIDHYLTEYPATRVQETVLMHNLDGHSVNRAQFSSTSTITTKHFEEALESATFNPFTYFCCVRGQLHVFHWNLEDELALEKYNSCAKKFTSLWRERGNSFMWLRSVVTDSALEYVYIVGYLHPEQSKSDICIFKMNLDSYEVEERFFIKGEDFAFVRESEVCYDQESNILYFFAQDKMISYSLVSQLATDSKLLFDDIEFYGDEVSSVHHNDALYIFYIRQESNILCVRKMEKDMSFITACTHKFSIPPCGMWQVTTCDMVHLWIFFRLPKMHCKVVVMSYDFDNHKLKLLGESRFRSKFKLCFGKLVSIPNYILC